MVDYHSSWAIWPCWIFLWLLPLIQGQSDGHGVNGSPGNFAPGGGFGSGGDRPGGFGAGRGKGKFGHKSGKGFRGSRFGEADSSQDDGQDQQDQGDDVAPEEEPTDKLGPDPSNTAPASDAAPPLPETTADPPPAKTNAAPAPLVTGEQVAPMNAAPTSVGAPSSITSTLEDTSTTQALAGIPIVAPSTSIANMVAATTDTAMFEQFSSTTTTTKSTVTTSMTVWVTPSSLPASAPLEEVTPSPTMNFAPLPTPTGPTRNASQQAGIGIGITFGVLSVAGAAGLYLWRRRRNRRFARDNATSRRPGGGLGGFFRLRSKNGGKGDAEWSIESAEKIEIVRGGSARAVRTGSRSDSPEQSSTQPPSSFPIAPPHAFPTVPPKASRSPSSDGLAVLKIGMRVPDRKHNLALTSNPISPSAFPSPPSSRGSTHRGPSGGNPGNTGSWPLPA